MIFSVRRNPRSSRQGFRSCRGGWCDGRLGTIRCYRRPFGKDASEDVIKKKSLAPNESPCRPPGPALTRAPPPRPIFAPALRASETRQTRSPPPAKPRYAPRCVRCSSVESPRFLWLPFSARIIRRPPRGGKSRAQVSASPNRARPRALTASVALRAIPLLGGFATASP